MLITVWVSINSSGDDGILQVAVLGVELRKPGANRDNLMTSCTGFFLGSRYESLGLIKTENHFVSVSHVIGCFNVDDAIVNGRLANETLIGQS